MRVSLRRAAKLTAIVIVVVISNFLISISLKLSENISTQRNERGDIYERVNNGRPSGGVQVVDTFGKPVDIGQKHPTLISLNKDTASGTIFKYSDKNAESASNAKNAKLFESDHRLVDNSTNGNASVKSNNHRRETELSDLFISVKTTIKFHRNRLQTLLDTWILLAKEQTHIFTDADDPELSNENGVHIVNTRCLPTHSRQALCCKMAIEYDTFMESKKRWFCHVDDDTYVNVPQLVKLLRKYNHTQDWYLGKPSLLRPIEIMDRKNRGQKIAFWFATGGAGFCISRSLALKMMPHASGGRLMTVGESIRLPDDCTVGYIINHILKKELTIIPLFHSHLESLRIVQKKDLRKQITYSYNVEGISNKHNLVQVSGFNDTSDPTRLRSLHCFLFPNFRQCRGLDFQS